MTHQSSTNQDSKRAKKEQEAAQAADVEIEAQALSHARSTITTVIARTTRLWRERTLTRSWRSWYHGSIVHGKAVDLVTQRGESRVAAQLRASEARATAVNLLVCQWTRRHVATAFRSLEVAGWKR